MGAIAKALSNYGMTQVWDPQNGAWVPIPNNNWYAVWTPKNQDGTCPMYNLDPDGSVGQQTVITSPPPGANWACEFVYNTPEQGISHALMAWFPDSIENGQFTPNPHVPAFHKAIVEGDTNLVAQMVMQRVWGIPSRAMPRDNPLATWTFASDFYNAANQIAANTGQTSHFKFPMPNLPNLQIIPIQVDKIPLPSGEIPGGGGAPPDQGGPDQGGPDQGKTPKEEKKSGYGKAVAGGLLALLLLGAAYKMAK